MPDRVHSNSALTRLRGYAAGSALLVLAIVCMRISSPMLAPVLLVLVVAVILIPFVHALQSRGLPEWLALSLVLLGAGVFVLIIAAILTVSSAELKARTPLLLEALAQERGDLEAWLLARGFSPSSLQLFDRLDPTAQVRSAGDTISGLIPSLVQMVAMLLLVTVPLTWLSDYSTRVLRRRGCRGIVPGQVTSVLDNTREGMLILSECLLLTGFGVALWLRLLDVDFALLWGLLFFLLGYIPSIGMLLAAIPAVALAYVQHGMVTAAFAAVGMAAISTTLMLLSRRAMSRMLRLPLLTAILSAFFWVWVFGPLGAILAWPLNAVALVLLRSNQNTQWVLPLIGASTPEE
jgi:AI-2 transport protein TqsA